MPDGAAMHVAVKLGDMPPHVQREVQRVLDGAARRLLADQMNGDPLLNAGISVGRRTGANVGASNDRTDERAMLVGCETVPVIDGDDQLVTAATAVDAELRIIPLAA